MKPSLGEGDPVDPAHVELAEAIPTENKMTFHLGLSPSKRARGTFDEEG